MYPWKWSTPRGVQGVDVQTHNTYAIVVWILGGRGDINVGLFHISVTNFYLLRTSEHEI